MAINLDAGDVLWVTHIPTETVGLVVYTIAP